MRGLLQLPSPADSGRVKFCEDASATLFPEGDSNVASAPIEIFDGTTDTPACLIDSFLRSHRFVAVRNRAVLPRPSHLRSS